MDPDRRRRDVAIDPDAPVREPQWDVTAVIVVGGIVGAEARYGLSVAVPHAAAGFPWSTVYINVIGCFGLGVLMAVLGRVRAPHRLIRPFVGIGILGGFTTFSTFAVDTERLIHADRPGLAGLYVLSTLLAGAAAVALGTVAVRAVAR